jgi:hypothetical protein
MRSGLAATTVVAMPKRPRTIRLDLDQSDGPLRGRVIETDCAAQEFEGWLGLLAVLGTALDGPTSGDAPSSSVPTPEWREEIP